MHGSSEPTHTCIQSRVQYVTIQDAYMLNTAGVIVCVAFGVLLIEGHRICAA